MKFFRKVEAKKPVRELSFTDLQSVSGGLNPQPLPPRVFSSYATSRPQENISFEYGGLQIAYCR
jgi:hypothetical protein